MSSKIKLVLEDRACKHHNAFYIPIVQENNVFYTGQKLSTKKMIGEEPLTPEENNKYPYIINPLLTYKVANGRTFNIEDEYTGDVDKAIYDLIGLCGKIAPSKSEYNSTVHKGYFANKQKDAEAELKKIDAFYYALHSIRTMEKSGIDAVCTMLYYTSRRDEFDINIENDSYEVKLAALTRMARTEPEKVMKCFKEHNPGIEEELFIYKLIHRGLIKKNGNEYFEAINGSQKNFMGNSLNKVIDYLTKRENDHIRGKFMTLLAEFESGNTVTIPLSRVNTEGKEKAKEFLVALIKAHIADGELSDASVKLSELKQLTGITDEYISLEERYNKAIASSVTANTAKDDFLKELNELSLEKILAKIRAPKSIYQYQDITEIIDDKEKIIQYMLDKKFNS